LETGGKARRLAHDTRVPRIVPRIVPRVVAVDRIADNYHAGGNPNARPELSVWFEWDHCISDYQGTADRPLGIVFVSARIAEIDQCPVARMSSDETLEPGDDFDDGATIGGHQIAQVFGVEARGQRCRFR
jgi:hypothetical protein